MSEELVNAKYIEFVESQIDEYKKYSDLGSKDEISPYDINFALANYTHVHLALIAEYQRVKDMNIKAKRNFDVWWNRKVYEARKAVMAELKGNKYPAAKEFDSRALVDNEVEYLEKKEALDELEKKVAFIRRLLEAWKSYDSMLVNLSLNMRSEMKALSLVDRSNKKQRQRLVESE